MAILEQLVAEIQEFATAAALKSDRWIDYEGADGKSLQITFSPVPGLLRLQQLGDERQIGELFPTGGTASARVRPGRYVVALQGRTSMPHEKFAFSITAEGDGVVADPDWRSDSECRVHVPYGPFTV